MPLLDATLKHLAHLVAFDTRNPPRAIDTGGIFAYLREQLVGFDCTTTDHGAGAVSLLAVRGTPTMLFNVHLDTVPDSPHWSASPFALRVDGERAVGLGACDIKGAAAAFIAAAAVTQGPAAFLFTSDEEANDPRCIKHFLTTHPSPPGRRWPEGPDEGPARAQPSPDPSPPGRRWAKGPDEGPARAQPGPDPSPLGRRWPEGPDEGPERAQTHSFDAIIVAEPTRSEAVLAHRGISSVLMRFEGRAGHASAEQHAADSALHQATRWGGRALDHVESLAHARFGGLTGLRFNIGRIEGGIKANVVAPSADVRFGFRPLPSMDTDDLLATFRGLAVPAPAEFTETFRGGSLPGGDVAGAESRRLAARDLADALDLPIGNAVDFWTEAALFSAAGYTTLVFGPGDIAQAHSADECVALEQLRHYAESIRRILDGAAA